MTLLCCEFFDILDVSKYKIHDMTIDILKNPCTYYESLEKLHFFLFLFFFFCAEISQNILDIVDINLVSLCHARKFNLVKLR